MSLRKALPSGSLLPLIFQFSELLCQEGWDFPQKGDARGSGLDGSWAKEAADLRALASEKSLQLPVHFCLLRFKLGSKCASRRNRWLLWDVPALHPQQCGETWETDPGEPAVVSHFCISCGPWEMDSHAPAAFHLTPLWMLALGDGRLLGWGCSKAKFACLKCVV